MDLEQYLTRRIAELETGLKTARDTSRAWQLKVEEVSGALSEMRLLKARISSTPTDTADKEPS